jgi:anti-anti-sigma factor
MMTDKPSADLLEVSEVRGVTVVHFTRRTILDPGLVEELGDRLLALVNQTNCRRLVLDFTRVESVTSAMLGKLVVLHNAIAEAGGGIVFASVDPFLYQIFQVCNLPQSIPIHASEAAAVDALASGT